MRIAVCMKWAPDMDVPEIVNHATGALVEEMLQYQIDGSSIAALEMAFRLQKAQQAELIVVMIAPAEADYYLREIYARGAHQIYRIWDKNLEDADVYVKSLVLSTFLRDFAPDLIVCGSRSGDTGSGQLAAYLAEMLDYAQVTGVAADIEIENSKTMLAYRRLQQGAREKLQVQLPAVVAVDLVANGIAYAPLTNYIHASNKTIHLIEPFELGLSEFDVSSWNTLNRLVSISQPRPVAQSIFTPDSGLDPIDRIRAIVSGGLEQKTGVIVEGSAEELAEKAFQYLLQHGFL